MDVNCTFCTTAAKQLLRRRWLRGLELTVQTTDPEKTQLWRRDIGSLIYISAIRGGTFLEKAAKHFRKREVKPWRMTFCSIQDGPIC